MVTLLTEVGIRIEPTMAAHTMDATKKRYDAHCEQDPAAWAICFAAGDVF